MSIYTKTGEKIIDVAVGDDCYYGGELLQIWATVQGELNKRQLYISDLREDRKNEIKDVIKATLKWPRTTV